MDHFWLVPNGMDFHTIRFFGYMEWILDIWNSGRMEYNVFNQGKSKN